MDDFIGVLIGSTLPHALCGHRNGSRQHHDALRIDGTNIAEVQGVETCYIFPSLAKNYRQNKNRNGKVTVRPALPPSREKQDRSPEEPSGRTPVGERRRTCLGVQLRREASARELARIRRWWHWPVSGRNGVGLGTEADETMPQKFA